MSPRTGTAGPRTLAFVESPVQLLNVLEWAHTHALGTPEDPAAGPFGSGGAGLTVVVLSPNDPMTRGQLRRMAELARDEGHDVRWEEARGGTAAPFRTVGGNADSAGIRERFVQEQGDIDLDVGFAGILDPGESL